ncbi:hypothetical protein [Psychromonas sp. L1A2]|uniref:hypothetical protein n=1 Tax=Psychromonas sp. L1A2 TaxID=2686356 RepID=UPI00135B80CF|nr:hypothetical protein [Psychromonas sp. L1A2]
MKKIALILLGGALLAGCQTTSSDLTTTANSAVTSATNTATSTATAATSSATSSVTSLTSGLLDTNFPSLSCSAIKQTFVDYEAQVASLESGSGLLATAGVSTASAKAKLDSAYDTAKETATPVMSAKGCSETL